MTNLRDTSAGRVVLSKLYEKYGTDDPNILLGAIVMEHFVPVFTNSEAIEMYRTMKLELELITILHDQRVRGPHTSPATTHFARTPEEVTCTYCQNWQKVFTEQEKS